MVRVAIKRPARKARKSDVWGRLLLSGAPERIEEGGVEVGRVGSGGAPLLYEYPGVRAKQ